MKSESVNVPLAASSDSKDSVVCPKPRRFGLLDDVIDDPVKPLPWPFCQQADCCDSKAGSDLLDIILSKGGYGGGGPKCVEVASSPPFFSGSPPSRVTNPLIQDARFGEDMIASPGLPLPPSTAAIPSGLSSSPSSARTGGGCMRSSFGAKPMVRIEGFDCLDRDRRNHSIPALA